MLDIEGIKSYAGKVVSVESAEYEIENIRTHGDAAGLPIASGLKTLAREIGVTHEALYRCVARMEKGVLLQRIDGRLQLPPAAQPAHAARP